MRLISVLLLTLFMVFTAPACSEEEAPTDEAAATEEGAEEKAEGEEKNDEGDEKKADEAAAKAGDGADKAEGEAKPADDPANAPVVDPKVSEDECSAACGHITTLTMSSLPAETKDEAKAKIAEALKERCPLDCLKHGTPESMKCVMAAKTAADLAACPK